MASYGATADLTLEQDVIMTLATSLRYGRGRLLFQIKANRDAVYREAVRLGMRPSRGSIRNQQLDPRYTVENRNDPDKGLGNDYSHFFSVLYSLDS